jgi:hypothetical protein
LATKENALTFSTPLTRTTNTIGIDLSGYPLKIYVDGSLNTINSTLATKQNTITAVTPLKKDVSNNLNIDLSVYTLLSSFNALSSTVSTKENALTFSTPLTRTTNTIGTDLSAYPLNTYVDGSLNIINSTLATKQTTNTIVRFVVGSTNATVGIDAVATDGLKRQSLSIGGDAIITNTSSYAALRKILKFTGVAIADDVAYMKRSLVVFLQVIILFLLIGVYRY